MSPRYAPHVRLKMKMIRALTNAVETAGLLLEVASEGSIAFGARFAPMPDVFLFDPTLVPVDHDGPIPGAAVRLVVEVSSTTLADDLGDKCAEYAQAGLAECGVADVAARVLRRHAKPSASVCSRIEATPLSAGAASWTLPGLALPPLTPSPPPLSRGGGP